MDSLIGSFPQKSQRSARVRSDCFVRNIFLGLLFVFSWLVLSLMVGRVFAAPHLLPDLYYASASDEYQEKLRDVFKQGYGSGVVLNCLVTPSFSTEYLVGVRSDDSGVFVFSMTPGSRVANVQWLEAVENGELKKYDEFGEELNYSKDSVYWGLRKVTPRDHRQITVDVKRKVIPLDVSNEIASVWRSALLGVRREEEPEIILDGAVYHYSMRLKGYGVVSGQVSSPVNYVKMRALTELADAMYAYSKGDVDVEVLMQKIKIYKSGAD
ncbi:hypothetical protein ACOAPY_20610 [Pseudomonas sp. P3C3]